jgi:hypothetical protein
MKTALPPARLVNRFQVAWKKAEERTSASAKRVMI